jgi:hypothetical protein
MAGMAALMFVAAQGAIALAGSGASTLPPEWHIHDGQTSLGSQHKGVGFFNTILGITPQAYLLDPASCPNATDKVFLPSAGESQSEVLRAGVCFTSTAVIRLRTVPLGVSGPDGWAFLSGTDGGGYITYYQVSPR